MTNWFNLMDRHLDGKVGAQICISEEKKGSHLWKSYEFCTSHFPKESVNNMYKLYWIMMPHDKEIGPSPRWGKIFKCKIHYRFLAWNSTFPVHQIESSIRILRRPSNKTLGQLKNTQIKQTHPSNFVNQQLTKGWSFLQPLRSSESRAIAIPDIIGHYGIKFQGEVIRRCENELDKPKCNSS